MSMITTDEQECKLVEKAFLDSMRSAVQKKLRKYCETQQDMIIEEAVQEMFERVKASAAKEPAHFSRWDGMQIRIFLNDTEVK